jgi:hypothetical protein
MAQNLDIGEKLIYRGGEECYDYVVMKGIGRHWDKERPRDTSYTKIATSMGIAGNLAAHNGNTLPHFASIRNRLSGPKFVLLSYVIEKVHQHDNQITFFIMAGCRTISPPTRPHRP